MFKKRGLNRKAQGVENKIYFFILQLVLIAAVFIVLVGFVLDAANNTMLEKNFLTRDIALLLNTLYAAPGNVTLEYENKALLKYNFKVAFDKNRVLIYNKDQEKSEAYQYYFLEDPAIKLEYPKEFMLEKEGEKIFFNKTTNLIKIKKIE